MNECNNNVNMDNNKESEAPGSLSGLMAGLQMGATGTDQKVKEKDASFDSMVTVAGSPPRLPSDKDVAEGSPPRSPVHPCSTSDKAVAKASLKSECESLIFKGKTEVELKKWAGFNPKNVREELGHIDARVLNSASSSSAAASAEEFPGLDGIRKEFHALPLSEVTQQRVLTLAASHDFLTAKWFFFMTNEYFMNQIWQGLCKDAVRGNLPDGVHSVTLAAIMKEGNVLTRSGNKTRPWTGRKVSIRVNNFSCARTKFQLFKYLEDTKVKAKLMLKPDIFTELQIYSDSKEYDIRPTIEYRMINMQAFQKSDTRHPNKSKKAQKENDGAKASAEGKPRDETSGKGKPKEEAGVEGKPVVKEKPKKETGGNEKSKETGAKEETGDEEKAVDKETGDEDKVEVKEESGDKAQEGNNESGSKKED